MRKVKTIILVTIVLLMTGCSTAGPFVTSISHDGSGGIAVEKCNVKYNWFTGTVSNSDCMQSNIRVPSGR